MSESPSERETLPRPLGAYELLARVAEGGMGVVYRARLRETGQLVAIKVMRERSRLNPVMLKRFELEFRAASSVVHPNLVRAVDFGDQDGVPYLVMEFVEGLTLSRMVERDGPLPEPEAVRLVSLVAQGLRRAHKKGIVHRDVKPDNIIVTPDGQARLTDMGLVKESGADLNLTRPGAGLGTMHYMAPEQFRNARLADARSDIYGLAATLYAVLTGKPPFQGLGPLDAWMKKVHDEFPAPREENKGISRRVDWAIRRGMRANPLERPATCREFVEDLLGRSTRPADKATRAPGEPETWYLRYPDENGQDRLVQGTRQGVRRSLREGLLGDARNVQGSMAREGPFKPLELWPEFRDLCLESRAGTARAQAPAPPNPAGVGAGDTGWRFRSPAMVAAAALLGLAVIAVSIVLARLAMVK